jgi:hypothetical protein
VAPSPRSKPNNRIRPVLGGLEVAKLDSETLESFCAALRRCRDRVSLEGRRALSYTRNEHLLTLNAGVDGFNCDGAGLIGYNEVLSREARLEALRFARHRRHITY